jgi:hypothetical protein
MTTSVWTVHTSWRRCGPVNETVQSYPDWPTARRHGRQLACLRGVLLVSVQDPDDVVVGEYDRATNRWREYHQPVS